MALAYSMVQDGPAAKKDNGKLVMRIIRDLLVLQICGGEASGPWDNNRLQAAMNSAFRDSIDLETMSQLVHSFKKIVENGKDRAKFDFDIYTAKVYGEPLEATQAEQIFAAYASCARGSPQYTRKHSGRQRSASPDRQRATSPEAAAAAACDAAGGAPPGLQQVPLAWPQLWHPMLVPGIGHAEAMLAWPHFWQQMRGPGIGYWLAEASASNMVDEVGAYWTHHGWVLLRVRPQPPDLPAAAVRRGPAC